MSSIWKRTIKNFHINSFALSLAFKQRLGATQKWPICTWILRFKELVFRTASRLGVLSIQQKFRFEISEISPVRWNGTFRLHRSEPSYLAFGYWSWKQDTKERYWWQQFCQIKRDISVRPTETTRPVKVDHLQSWSWIFRSDQTEMVRSIWCTNRNVRNFGLNGKHPGLHGLVLGCSMTTRLFWEAAAFFIGYYDEQLLWRTEVTYSEILSVNGPYACLRQTSKFHHQASFVNNFFCICFLCAWEFFSKQ